MKPARQVAEAYLDQRDHDGGDLDDLTAAIEQRDREVVEAAARKVCTDPNCGCDVAARIRALAPVEPTPAPLPAKGPAAMGGAVTPCPHRIKGRCDHCEPTVPPTCKTCGGDRMVRGVLGIPRSVPCPACSPGGER